MEAALASPDYSSVARLRWAVVRASELRSMSGAWDAIATSNQNVPFLRSDFLLPLLGEFGTGRERLVVGTDGGDLVAAALVQPSRIGAWTTFQPSQLPLGAIVAAPGFPIGAIGDAMLRALPPTVLQLGLTQLDPWLFPRPGDEANKRTLDFIETAWIDVIGDYETYWAARGKNLRKGLPKQARELQAEGVSCEFEVLTSPQDVALGLRDLSALEGAGWKAALGTAIQPNNAQGRFYAAMLASFAERGAARVYRYKFNRKPVAVDLCIEAGSLQIVLKTAYDESIKRHSPAFLMRQQELELEWSAGRIKRIEFFGRRMEWHTRWTENYRTLYHLNIYRSPLVARLHSDLSRFRGYLKRTKTVGETPVSGRNELE